MPGRPASSLSGTVDIRQHRKRLLSSLNSLRGMPKGASSGDARPPQARMTIITLPHVIGNPLAPPSPRALQMAVRREVYSRHVPSRQPFVEGRGEIGGGRDRGAEAGAREVGGPASGFACVLQAADGAVGRTADAPNGNAGRAGRDAGAPLWAALRDAIPLVWRGAPPPPDLHGSMISPPGTSLANRSTPQTAAVSAAG